MTAPTDKDYKVEFVSPPQYFMGVKDGMIQFGIWDDGNITILAAVAIKDRDTIARVVQSPWSGTRFIYGDEVIWPLGALREEPPAERPPSND